MSVLLLDGGLASHVESQHGALHPQLWSAGLLVPAAQPQGQVWLREAHRDFLAAGAQLIETATYQATPQALADAGAVADLAQAEACVRAAVDWAHEERAAAAGKGKVLGPRWWLKTPDLSALVVGSAGPYGATLADGSEYRGNWGLLPQQYENYHRSRLQIFAQAFVCPGHTTQVSPSRKYLNPGLYLFSFYSNRARARWRWWHWRPCRMTKKLWLWRSS